MNRADVRAMQADSDEVSAALENAARPKGSYVDEYGQAVVSRLESLLGVDEAKE